jgi:hypothetical protein
VTELKVTEVSKTPEYKGVDASRIGIELADDPPAIRNSYIGELANLATIEG